MHRKVSLIAFLGITLLSFVLPSSAGSNLSKSYHTLFIWLTVVSALVLILVVAIWIYVMKTFNETNEDVERKPISHETSRKLEFGWTATAILIVLILMALSYPILFSQTNVAQTADDGDVRIIVQGTSNWEWKYILPNGTIISPTIGADQIRHTDITLTVGTKYTFIFWNTAGFIHSYYVPDLNIKMDVVPGVNNTYTFTIVDAGQYQLMCAEFCGADHSFMRGTITAVDA